ncbi:MAG: threonine aldolase family protein [Rhodospirillales bacterium]
MSAQLASDNITGASPEVLDAVRAAAEAGPAGAYGDDAWTERAAQKIRDVFEAPKAEVLFCATGTAANSIALAAMTPPWGAVLCHPESHIHLDECGAPEFYSGGAKLLILPDRDGRITPGDVGELGEPASQGVHSVPPAALSLTQASERGLVYSEEQIRHLTEAAKECGLRVHMDGARFANACAALDTSPAALTWKAGVDVLCLGATKNGALAAEAVVVFDPAPGMKEELERRRKRGGHLFSKMRFISAQFEAWLTDDLWLRNARHANAMAAKLSAGLGVLPNLMLHDPCEANEVFIWLPRRVAEGLRERGIGFATWRKATGLGDPKKHKSGQAQSGQESPDAGTGAGTDAGGPYELARMVCAFSTPEADVDAVLKAAGELALK